MLSAGNSGNAGKSDFRWQCMLTPNHAKPGSLAIQVLARQWCVAREGEQTRSDDEIEQGFPSPPKEQRIARPDGDGLGTKGNEELRHATPRGGNDTVARHQEGRLTRAAL